MLQAQSWDKIKSKSYNFGTKTPSPLPDNILEKVFNKCGPYEGTSAAYYKLNLEAKFSYRTLLGKMMYAYVTCCPDIGYAITTMNKSSAKPSTLHCHYLKGIAKYLRLTKDWGIKLKHSAN